MKLSELIKNIETIDVVGNLDVEVSDIAYHAGKVVKNGCFVAIVGNVVDGHDYVDMAIENGASVVVSSKRIDTEKTVTNIIVENERKALALLSSAFFKEPSKKVNLIGITGTNGKTTITYILESIWKVCGKTPGVIGTVNYRYGDVLTNPEHTTPESYDLQHILSDMVKNNVDSVAMEVSSHSLAQDRVSGCHFDGAVFTNLTQDHLDYHLDMDRYMAAKALLFNKYLPESDKGDGFAVVNVDDEFGRELAKGLSCKLYAYSIKKEVDVYIKEADYSFSGMALKVVVENKEISLKSSLIGRHNASNIIGAIAAAHASGISLDKIVEGVEALDSVPGRLEPVKNSKGLNVLVDYAHTPDALKNVTTALKALKPKRLITVFGCGGDRDKTKRPLMGYETAMNSDLLYITSDNPRTENPRKIVDEVVTGVMRVGLEEGSGYFVEVDRKKAIEAAIKTATKKDVVLIAGKGHEDYQIIGKEKYDFDDAKIASEIIESI